MLSNKKAKIFNLENKCEIFSFLTKAKHVCIIKDDDDGISD
jgi:hypothetical protein